MPSATLRPTTDSDVSDDALYKNVDLVIFDFDGVIADSEVISLASLRETLHAYGIDLSLDDVRDRFLGASLKTIIAEVEALSPRRTSEGFRELWHTVLFARFRAELGAMPGLIQLLDRLESRGILFCIASSGSFERIDIALKSMDLIGRFNHVFSAQLVANGKPAPDLFLHAAEQVGVPPERCLVIEDSPFGITAANAAAMRSIGFLGGAHLHDIRQQHQRILLDIGAHHTVEALDEVMPASKTT